MEKIITLFQRNYETDRLVRDEVVPGAEWVLAGEGTPTRKFDGTSCLMRDGVLYKRYDAKKGKTPPLDFIPAQPSPDPVTGHWPGWVPVSVDAPEDRYHREALEWDRKAHGSVHNYLSQPDWTYELVGPKVQGNAEGYFYHVFVRHGDDVLRGVQLMAERNMLNFETIKDYLATEAIEGIVWWRNPDDYQCDKVKIKRRDFKLPWPIKAS